MDSIKFNPDTPFVRKVLLQVCVSWIEDNDREYFSTHPISTLEETLNQLFSILLELFDMYKFPRHMFVPVVLYADRFVGKYGIKHNQLFNLLLTSTLIAMKFWDDTTPITNKRVADAFRYTTSEVRIMEQRFLKGLDYSLSLTADELKFFIFEAAKIELRCARQPLASCTPLMRVMPVGVTARV